MLRVFLLIALLFGAASSARADPRAPIPSYKDTIGIDALRIYMDLKKPLGFGPFPAVILAPECHGFRSAYTRRHYEAIKERLVALGYVVVNADSLRARWDSSCWDGGFSTEAGANDIAELARFLQRQDYVEKDSIHAIGWGFGGNITIIAGSTEISAPLRRVVAYYPVCRALWEWQAAAPILAISGANDTIAPPAKCQQFLEKHAAVSLVTLPGSYHFFDLPIISQEPTLYYTGLVAYDPRAAEQAWKLTLLFLE